VTPSPQGVLFDWDHTAYNQEQTTRTWIEVFVREHLPAPNFEEAIATLISLDQKGGCPRKEFFAKVVEMYSLLDDVDALEERFHQEIIGHMDVSEMKAISSLLNKKGIPFGFVTNGSRRQKVKIQALGLTPLCVTTAGEVGIKKPDPAIFLMAADCLGVPPENILFVGDHPEQDVLGAIKVGMMAAWVSYGQAWPANLSFAPDLTLLSVGDLLAVLDGLQS